MARMRAACGGAFWPLPGLAGCARDLNDEEGLVTVDH
jgi:hypothetical protein